MSAALDVLPQRPSLLHRRASNNPPDLPDRLSVAALLAPATQSPGGSAHARGTPRRPPPSFLPFVPLTPIMASPLLTPDVAHASTPAAVLDSAARQQMAGHDPPHGDDYISHHTSAPTPTWMTSPPTPPPKHASSPRAVPSPSASPARATRGRSKTHSQSSRNRSTSRNRSSPRPASFVSYTPTPLSRSYSPSPSMVSPATKVAHLSKPLPPRPVSDDGAPEELPPVPMSSASAPIDTAADEGTLLPSLSRRAGAAQEDAAAALDPAETGTLRARARKLFSLADDEPEGEVSDPEDRTRGSLPAEKRGARQEAERERDMAEARDLELEKERAERVRRYHALMELLTTEVGYLLDLRALVTVYLDQLLLLSSPPTATVNPTPPLGASGLPLPPLAQPPCLGVPLPSSGRSMTSLSALSIPSLFPSSRSSLFHLSSAPSPSRARPNDGSLRDRTRQSSGASTSTESASRERVREREREKENLERAPPPKPSKSSRQVGPVMGEKEVRAVYRNAHELLQFHERFVGELRAAVGPVGFGMMFSGDEAWLKDMSGEGEGLIADLVEHAVEVVATKFVNEAPSFSIYETFCPGHAAATNMVRHAQDRWPAVWDAYEQRCGLLIVRSADATARMHDRGRSDNDMEAPSPPASEDRDGLAHEEPLRKKRRHSTPALSFASQFPPGGPPPDAGPTQLPFPSASNPLPTTSNSERRLRMVGPKLKFMDYLIKPVQRICKYPLLLDQLRPKRSGAYSPRQVAADEAVKRAGEVMREVVSRVNHASEKEAHNLRSALIVSRIAFTHAPSQSAPPAAPSAYPPPATSSSSSGSSSSHGHGSSSGPSSASSCTSPTASKPTSATASPGAASLPPLTTTSPRAAGLTAEFVSSLGPCMLAGALDVIQHPAHRAKYLGAFLYAGGYCILVKVTKSGRVYEPRHWFAFGTVEVVDREEDDPAFPYSFHVLAQGQHLQLGASCTQEKAVWLGAINDALAAKHTWVNEPLSSFQADVKSPQSALDDAPLQDSPTGLPTIQSLSELEKQADTANPQNAQNSPTTDGTAGAPPSAPAKGQLKYSRTLSRLDSIALRQEQHTAISAALSRRSSTASVKAFFSPISFDPSRIARPSAQVRAQVEHGLHDLFSEQCVAARSHAQLRGEELFQVRATAGAGGLAGKRQASGLPRSNSGLSIANAMGLTAAKRRYDSVLVSRRKASMEGVPDLSAMSSEGVPSPLEASVSASSSTGVPSASSTLAGRAKSLAVRRHKKQPASIAPAITSAIAQLNAEAESQRREALVRRPEGLSLDSPPAASQCSSASSHPGSMLPSPADAAPLPIPVPGLSPNGTLRQSDILQVLAGDAKPKRSRSMVNNVRGFFQQRRMDALSTAPSSYPEHGLPSPPLLAESPSAEYPSGIVQWLRRTSIRRRESSSSRSTAEEHCQYEGRRRPLPTRNSTDGVSRRGTSPAARAHGHPTLPHRQISQSQCPRGALDESAPKRRRSLFVPSSHPRDRAPAPRDEATHGADHHAQEGPSASTSLSSRKSIKSFFFFQRSNSLTPLG
ncbi:hypothetical protein BD413DRAFT_602617 [Trametes elegans]|nr:hypothetical protein BD413DRAFT_602617 [Trametes elegans]